MISIIATITIIDILTIIDMHELCFCAVLMAGIELLVPWFEQAEAAEDSS